MLKHCIAKKRNVHIYSNIHINIVIFDYYAIHQNILYSSLIFATLHIRAIHSISCPRTPLHTSFEFPSIFMLVFNIVFCRILYFTEYIYLFLCINHIYQIKQRSTFFSLHRCCIKATFFYINLNADVLINDDKCDLGKNKTTKASSWKLHSYSSWGFPPYKVRVSNI